MNKDPLLITATYNGLLTIWNTKKQKWTEDILFKPDSDYSINKLSISNDSNFLGAACSEGLRIFDISKNKQNFCTKRFQNSKTNVVSVGFDIKTQYVYYSTEGGTLNIIDLRDGKEKILHTQDKDINTCLLNPNQGELIFGDSSGNVKVFDLIQNKIKANLCLSNGIALRAIDFSLDASLFAVADQEGTVRTVSMAEDQILRVINKTKIHDDYILNIKFSNDKKYLASCSADQTVKIFEIENNGKISEKHTLYGHTQWVWDISILSSNKHLLSVSTDGSLKLWDIENGNLIKEFYNDSALRKDNEKNFRKGYVAITFKDYYNQNLQIPTKNINVQLIKNSNFKLKYFQ